MRAFRIIVTGLLAAAALVAGLFVAAVVALTATLALVARGLFGQRRPRAVPPVRQRETAASRDVIDVSATEVPAERLER